MSKEEIMGCLDLPSNGTEIYKKVVELHGWSLSTLDDELSIEILIDDKIMGKTRTGVQRLDVAKVFPTVKGARRSGFFYEAYVGKLSDGAHNLKVLARSNKGEKLLASSNFELCINEPTPPDELIDFIGGGPFRHHGREFFRYFLELGKLKPNDLDVIARCYRSRKIRLLSDLVCRIGHKKEKENVHA